MLMSRWTALVCRILLIALVIFSVMLALTPNLNLAHWTPGRFLRQVGFSYQHVLAYEHHLLTILHFVGGLVATLLLYGSAIALPGRTRYPVFSTSAFVVSACVVLEWLQPLAGRNAQLADALWGIFGVLVASCLLGRLVRRAER